MLRNTTLCYDAGQEMMRHFNIEVSDICVYIFWNTIDSKWCGIRQRRNQIKTPSFGQMDRLANVGYGSWWWVPHGIKRSGQLR